jgi:NADH-quinone oxidoreductase subunit C
MIIETVRQQLQSLFPASPEAAPITGGLDAQEGPKVEKGGKEAPRVDGIIDRKYAERGYHLDVQLAPDQLLAAVGILFDCGFFIETITGVDWIKDQQIEAVYDFSRYDFDLCRVVIRTRTPRSQPVLPTITGIYTGANWHERETHDFFGIVFQGHPHLIPLLLPEDADFHPLLKDFKA